MDFNLEEYICAIVRECIAEGPEMKTWLTAEDMTAVWMEPGQRQTSDKQRSFERLSR
ncbi:MAG: hypothetical protein ACLVDB_03675 [Anaeromassilibacillus sp.]